MKIQILISKNSWANKYKANIKNSLKKFSEKIFFTDNHKKLKNNYDICIVFSYFKIIEKKSLKFSKHNLILHESDLPKGRGMSPLTWQIIKGGKNITFSILEASDKIDNGKIYFKKIIKINNKKIFTEIKEIQLLNNLHLIKKFLKYFKRFKKAPPSKIQKGKPTYFKLRKSSDSKIDINKTIKSQFNLLRVCDDENYPSFFNYKNTKFFIKLYKNK